MPETKGIETTMITTQAWLSPRDARESLLAAEVPEDSIPSLMVRAWHGGPRHPVLVGCDLELCAAGEFGGPEDARYWLSLSGAASGRGMSVPATTLDLY